MKKLSARRKKPSWGRGFFASRIGRMWRCRTEWLSCVAKRWSRDPPSGLKPQAMASASISVDLPEPFSPTMKVTRGWNFRLRVLRTTGRLNG